MSTKFTEKAENALNRSVRIAEAYGHTYIGSEHILYALSEDEGCCASGLLKKRRVTREKLDAAIKQSEGAGVKTTLSSKDTTPRCRRILEGSYKIAKKYSSDKIGTEHLLLALLDEQESVAIKILLMVGADISILRDEVIAFLKTAVVISDYSRATADEPIPNLLKYGHNMTLKAEVGEYDPVIGRDKETERLIRILTRKNKNNPCLIGEAGVGKTAIVEGLAQRIAAGNVPEQLRGKILISIDLTSMIAGAKYRGDFEDRIKNILSEAAKNKSVILFIDEIHTIVGAGSAEGAIDAANIMKPQLSRGDIRVIGATTINEYRKYIEKDSALERRFQPLVVEEPDEEEALMILRGLRGRYESYHGIILSDEALKSSIRLSKRYVQDRYLPDKAIDLIDEACAKVSGENQKCAKYAKEDENIGQSLNLAAMVFSKTKDENLNSAERGLSYTRPRELTAEVAPTVLASDIEQIVTELYGVNIFDDRTSPGSLCAELSSVVLGQDAAVKAIASAVTRSFVGINDERRPKGVFLFVGESGVGKTELARALCYRLFSDKDALISYDMSEFSEQSSVSKLIGSAPGYVGYDDTNSALEKIRRHPYSVILLDEIEKAHPDVLALFLQVFDNGILTDASGRRISFRNAYIIMTSNACSNKLSDGIGFLGRDSDERLNSSLKEIFRPEFIDRIDEIVRFSALDTKTLGRIAEIKLEERRGRLSEMGIELEYDESLPIYLGEITKAKGLGARPLQRTITTSIDTGIAELISLGKLRRGDCVRLEVGNNGGSDEVKIVCLSAITEATG